LALVLRAGFAAGWDFGAGLRAAEAAAFFAGLAAALAAGFALFLVGALRAGDADLPAAFLAGAARLAGDLVTGLSSVGLYTPARLPEAAASGI
jgi:Flp pilus assembly protein protease CpaA